MSHWKDNMRSAHIGRLLFRIYRGDIRHIERIDGTQTAMIEALTTLAWEETNKSVGLDSRVVNDFGLKHTEVEWKRK